MTSPDALPALVALIREIAGRASAAGPLPRGWAHLGLDHATATSLDELAGLARHGIFRKYDQVLFLAGGLGAPARWVAAQLGCTAITTTPCAREAALGRGLTRAAGVGDAVLHLVASSERLPVGDGAVTHVWAMESLATVADPAVALEEARRIVRPGGQLAIIESVSTAGRFEVGGRAVDQPDAWMARVREAGFVDVVASSVDDATDQPGARIVAARTQLEDRLESSGEPELARLAERQRALTSARAALRVRTIRIHARRP